MVLSQLLGFLAMATLVIVTPGPDTALTVRNTLAGGRRAGIFTGIGVALGQLVWTAGTSLGVLGILLASERAFSILKIIGAAYLIYLGIHSLRAALSRGEIVPAAPTRSVSSLRALRQGLVNDLANPKMAAFFASLLPQFVAGRDHVGWQMLALGAIFSVMTCGWLACYSTAIGRFSRMLRQGRIRRVFDGVAGVVLVGFGIRLATSEP